MPQVAATDGGTKLVEGGDNDEVLDGDPETIQQLANTGVLALHYRTNVDSR